jgi:TPR repeat protein
MKKTNDYRKKKKSNSCNAIEQFRSSANQGNAESMYKLGSALLQGKIVNRNPVEATQWLEKSASLGYPLALVTIGMFYLEGFDGYKMNTNKGLSMLKKAHQKGAAEASLSLGIMYLGGFNVTQNTNLAIKYLKTAAEHGDSNARSYLERLGVAGYK